MPLLSNKTTTLRHKRTMRSMMRPVNDEPPACITTRGRYRHDWNVDDTTFLHGMGVRKLTTVHCDRGLVRVQLSVRAD